MDGVATEVDRGLSSRAPLLAEERRLLIAAMARARSRLLVTAGNVTGIVDRLVRLGLAERRPVPQDRRAVRVRLTARGRQIMRRIIPRHRRDVAVLLGRVPPEDLARLRDLLGNLARLIEDHAA